MPGGHHDQPSNGARPSPEERYEEFAKENERWNQNIDQALDEMDQLMPDSASPSRKSELARA